MRGWQTATGRRKIITMETEHKAVLDTCAHLIDAQVVYLKPESDGLLSLDSLAKVLDDTVLLVSVMLVNNETGVIQPIERDRSDGT